MLRRLNTNLFVLCRSCLVICIIPSAKCSGNIHQRFCNVNLRKLYKNIWCLVPFSSNISCVRPQSVSVLARIKNQSVIYISLRYCVVQRGTQQENSATKRAFTGRSWATLGRVNKASFPVMFIYKYKKLITARRIGEGNGKLTVA